MPSKALAPSTPGKIGKKKHAPQLTHKRLTKKHVHAATLQAAGKLTASEVCAAVGITRAQLEVMRKAPVYIEELARQVSIFRNRVDGSILGQKTKRNEFREKLVKKLAHIVTKRAQNADKGLVAAGGATGLVIKKPNGRPYVTGRGKNAKLEAPFVYEVDHPTVERFQSLMNDIAKENGEMGSGSNAPGVQVTVVLTQEDQAWL